MTQEPTTHDYTRRYWGHDYTFDPIDGGMTGKMAGWGYGIAKGDYLIIDGKNGSSTRYQVTKIEYQMDPRDMWFASVTFAPRPRPEEAQS